MNLIFQPIGIFYNLEENVEFILELTNNFDCIFKLPFYYLRISRNYIFYK